MNAQHTLTQTTNITDNQQLVSVTNRFGRQLPIYDDGFGPLWIHRDSMGISGIVRAQTWEDAYSICEDEFFPEADETVEELEAEHSTIYLSGRGLWDHENPDRPFHLLAEHEKIGVLQARPGKDVPFTLGFTEHPCFQEAYGFRPNGAHAKDKHGHGIYTKDLNGDSLDRLTDELAAELELTLEIEERNEG